MTTNTDVDVATPRPTRKPTAKPVVALAQSFADVERQRKAEEAGWAARSGPVTVRYIEKNGASK